MSASETTPLSYGSTSAKTTTTTDDVVNQMKGVWKMVFQQENMEAAQDALKDLHRTVNEGNFSIRFLALVAGIVLVITSFFGILGQILHFRFTLAVIEFYTCIMACLLLLLESSGHIRAQQERGTNPSEPLQVSAAHVSMIDHVMQSIFKYALFLKFIWGRGGLYVVAGSLQLAQGSFYDYIVGGLVVFVGVVYIGVGRQTARKLTQLRQSLAQHTLRTKFQQADKDGNGQLNLTDFQHLVESLEISLSRRELEVAFMSIDQHNVGYLTFEEFQNWWSHWEEGNDFII